MFLLIGGYPPGVLAGSSTWSWVSDQVVAGICHDLSGVLTSLLGQLELAEVEAGVTPELGAALRGDLDRIAGLLELLRALPAGQNEVAELVRPMDILPMVSALLRRHRGLEELKVRLETEADPLIYVKWNSLIRLLLLIVSTVGRAARDARGTELVIRISTTDSVAEIEILPEIEVAASTQHEDLERAVMNNAMLVGVTHWIDIAAEVEETVRTEVEAEGGSVRARGGSILLSFPLYEV